MRSVLRPLLSNMPLARWGSLTRPNTCVYLTAEESGSRYGCREDARYGLTLCLLSLDNCAQVLFEAQGRSGKNKAVEMEDIKFHQCVRLARFENDRTISFIPPDGNFDLMCAPSGYRV